VGTVGEKAGNEWCNTCKMIRECVNDRNKTYFEVVVVVHDDVAWS